LSADVVSMALCENFGYPVDWPRLQNLHKNTELMKIKAIEDCVAVYPFFVKSKKGDWVQKYDAFKKFVEDSGLAKNWPKTDSGKYASDEKTLDHYSGLPEISALKYCNKTVGQLKWFRDENWDQFLDRMGLDFHVRSYLNPYGTQTGRNAPPAKIFIPAMSAWLRALIRPEPGYAITALDWEAQEFGIGAALSGDYNMTLAYKSRDPYSWFAKRVKAMPKDGDKKSHPEIRNLFKSTVLGLGYLMGDKGLAAKLSADTKKIHTEADAAKLSGYHKQTFSRYWTFLEECWQEYQNRGTLSLANGWTVFGDNPNHRSIKNLPIQGAGSVMMRRAVRKAQARGVIVLFPLHDAVYIYHPEGSTQEIKVMQECMDEACAELLGDKLLLRVETNTYTHDKLYIEDKARKQYEAFAPYLDKDFTETEASAPVESVEQQTLKLGE